MAVYLKAFTPVMQAMHDGHLVLTPNHRTYTQLLDFYGRWLNSQHKSKVCLTPRIYPIDIWIREQWLRLPAKDNSRQQILDPMQESLIWQDIIRDSDPGPGLINKKATARSVQEAWRLTHLWKIELAELRKLGHSQKKPDQADDFGAFLSWVSKFEKFCRRHCLVSLSELVVRVTDNIYQDQVAVAENITFNGFHSPPPLYRDLIKALTDKSSQHFHFDFPSLTPQADIKPCSDAQQECHSAANWARNILTVNPDARIGIICPDLKTRAASLQRFFGDTFAPELAGTLSGDSAPMINLSLQTPLLDCPLINTAFSILELNNPWVDTLPLCQLLHSPFILESQTEESARSHLEYRLRDSGELKVQLSWVRELCSKHDKNHCCESLAKALMTVDSLRRELPARMTCAQFSDLFEAQLLAMGWPGGRSLTITETSQLKSWSSILKTFKESSHWYNKVSEPTALSRLRELASSHSASSSRDQAPVQIMSPVEADGLVFTHTWIMGLSEQQWPPGVRPSPFIPLGLQKSAGIPESDIALLTAQARQQLQQFSAYCESEIIFSYPQLDDELVMKPAAMLSAFAENKKEETVIGDNTDVANLLPASARQMLKDNATQLYRDSNNLNLAADEAFTGSMSLIADQADCPFRAFALHRLKAMALPVPVIGLPGHVLGSILHEVMEVFWQALKDQQHLMNATEEELSALADNAISLALQNKARFYRYSMTARFIDLESRRLKALLFDWLAEERKRGMFVVLESEYKVQWQHAGLSLNMRIDRLDETAEGGLVIVDYKSPKNSEINWLDDRQTEPQLMLYMLAVEAGQARQVDGLFIAQINVEESRYKGISNNNAIYPKSLFNDKRKMPDAITWEEIKQSWQLSLSELASEFLAGFVAINPKSTNCSCTWCHLGGFCRINDEAAQ